MEVRLRMNASCGTLRGGGGRDREHVPHSGIRRQLAEPLTTLRIILVTIGLPWHSNLKSIRSFTLDSRKGTSFFKEWLSMDLLNGNSSIYVAPRFPRGTRWSTIMEKERRPRGYPLPVVVLLGGGRRDAGPVGEWLSTPAASRPTAYRQQPLECLWALAVHAFPPGRVVTSMTLSHTAGRRPSIDLPLPRNNHNHGAYKYPFLQQKRIRNARSSQSLSPRSKRESSMAAPNNASNKVPQQILHSRSHPRELSTHQREDI
ncbi:hypothetical protein Nepgr_020762 [Nepenthes gracilis]|uniref:Uncharacterized protein n=1 Tax=Nepenthes gracilis TaxID=150966 RepID=A0AAD3SZH4_NEPGR|nr:hypothetical protein Nepgr_020762 [Nepenthes gracilis]